VSQLPPFVLEMLACPRCRGRLVAEAQSLRCDACRLRYPVRNGIPNLLVDEAERVRRKIRT
jgi:uncharacterized protein YbaR (Trm112 family)